jgi:hypothetical protein
MDIETVIGCLREARLGRRMTAGLEGCERPGGDAGRAGGRSRCATESQPEQRTRSADMDGLRWLWSPGRGHADPVDLLRVTPGRPAHAVNGE